MLRGKRLNAILELGRVLTNAVAEGVDFELAEMTGGNANNAIPPHAQMIVTIDESAKPQFEGLLSAAQTKFRNRGETNATVSLVANERRHGGLGGQAPVLSFVFAAYCNFCGNVP